MVGVKMTYLPKKCSTSCVIEGRLDRGEVCSKGLRSRVLVLDRGDTEATCNDGGGETSPPLLSMEARADRRRSEVRGRRAFICMQVTVEKGDGGGRGGAGGTSGLKTSSVTDRRRAERGEPASRESRWEGRVPRSSRTCRQRVTWRGRVGVPSACRWSGIMARSSRGRCSLLGFILTLTLTLIGQVHPWECDEA
jgi:hypothetical protein